MKVRLMSTLLATDRTVQMLRASLSETNYYCQCVVSHLHDSGSYMTNYTNTMNSELPAMNNVIHNKVTRPVPFHLLTNPSGAETMVFFLDAWFELGAINSRFAAAVAAPYFAAASGSMGSVRAERCRANSRAFPLRLPPFSRANFDFRFIDIV